MRGPIAALCALALAPACGGCSRPPLEADFGLGTTTPAPALKLAVGQTFTFALACPSGRRWRVESYDKSILEEVGSAPGAQVAPDTKVFRFRAIEPGETVIRLRQSKKWRGRLRATKTVNYPVVVE